MRSITKMIRSTPISLLPLFVMLIALSFTEADARTNQNVNRVRPPQGTSQYVKEASRVRLLTMGERLNLSDDQLLKLRKAQVKMEEKCDKEIEKAEKARQKYEKEKEKSLAKQSQYIKEYEEEMEKILTPEQLEGYKLLRRQEAESLRLNGASSEEPASTTPEPEEGPSPIVKAQDPPLMY